MAKKNLNVVDEVINVDENDLSVVDGEEKLEKVKLEIEKKGFFDRHCKALVGIGAILYGGSKLIKAILRRGKVEYILLKDDELSDDTSCDSEDTTEVDE